jgi:outer membrane immunogenic protein
MKKLMLGVAAALFTFTTSNAIADGPYRRPPPTIAAPRYEAPPPPSWTGLYFGVGLGGGAALHDFNVNRWNPWKEEWHRNGNSVGDDVFFGTVTLGYDWQHSHFVAGVFVDYDFSDTSTSFDDGWHRRTLSFDNAWAVGGRLGFLSNPATLWYISAGYTEAEIGDSSINTWSGHRISFDDTLSGYFVGAGVDTRLHSNWFLRLEYRFTQLDSDRFEVNQYVNHELEPSLHTARLTLTYKFTHGLGWGGFGGWGKW